MSLFDSIKYQFKFLFDELGEVKKLPYQIIKQWSTRIMLDMIDRIGSGTYRHPNSERIDNLTIKIFEKQIPNFESDVIYNRELFNDWLIENGINVVANGTWEQEYDYRRACTRATAMHWYMSGLAKEYTVFLVTAVTAYCLSLPDGKYFRLVEKYTEWLNEEVLEYEPE